MHVAVVYNTPPAGSVDPAFTPDDDLAAVVDTVGRLGHRVSALEVSGPAGDILERVAGSGADLVLNIAEGPRNGWRQSLYRMLFEDAGLPHAGSPANVLTVADNKHLTKLVAHRAGLPTPRWQFVRDVQDIDTGALVLPAIVKPNFEGWSTGISAANVVGNATEAVQQAKHLLEGFGDGVLIEEFIPGRDVTVGYLEAADTGMHGVLEPVEYIYPRGDAADRAVLDEELKTRHPVGRVRADLAPGVADALRRATLTMVRALGCRDVARVDFRVTGDGRIRLLEVNAAPGCRPGMTLDLAREVPGDGRLRNIADAIITSAAHRHQLTL
ncbi:D-alanine-D-alanine ligase [Stackebrandtia albiflava]|uniref:D-alanine-D-alanine ligase n=1 Tax=Stackebrandtia albiflava TaxID=406432 RepID=A0A562VE16_9ACTN|nr:hypothetical protein [Stackebrandtia albiflava]TWJ16061.1 D-alanine-D-alanine ligase [Stackebrandtia albiflava]